MSIRPREVATEATRFSLRTIFAAAPEPVVAPSRDAVYEDDATALQLAAPTAATAAAPTAAQPPLMHARAHLSERSSGGLRFDLTPAAATATATTAATATATATAVQPPLLSLPVGGATGAGFKFTLPSMRLPSGDMPMPAPPPIVSSRGHHDGSGAAGSGTAAAGGGEKMLRAGYLTGGASSASNPEVMRLNGIIEDLQMKLKRSAERLATTEQSVARGNAALQSERATSHARIVALAGEVRNAQQREASVRAEMTAMPKVSDFDQNRFEIQARGAMEVQARFEEELKRAQTLEEVLSGLQTTHDALTSEHAALQTKLTEATASRDEALIDACNARVAVADAQGDTARIKKEALGMIAEAENRAAEAVAASLAAATLNNDDTLNEADDQDGGTPTSIDYAQHLETVAALERDLVGVRAELAASRQALQEEQTRSAEADVLIKSLDLKLASLRSEAKPQSPPVPPIATTAAGVLDPPAGADAAVVAQFERYFALKRAAETATEALHTAGVLASDEAIADAAHAHSVARRAYDSLCTGEPEAPLVLSCVIPAPDDEDHTETHAQAAMARLALSTAMCGASALLMGRHHDFDCNVDLALGPDSPDADCCVGTAATPPTDAAVSLKMRTTKYVTSVSKDIKRKLRIAQRTWLLAAGESPPPLVPEACDDAEAKRNTVPQPVAE